MSVNHPTEAQAKAVAHIHRARLIDLESQQQENIDTLAELEQTARERQQQIAEARRQYERETNLEAAHQQSEQVKSEYERLTESFRLRAEGHLWFEGILPHQWTGCQFGAVAKRWILGDGVGLGKTRETIAWLDLVGARKVLIVCEANICNQFAGEVMDLAPHRTLYNLYRRKTRQRKGVKETWPQIRQQIINDILNRDEATVVVNYEIWRKDKTILHQFQRWGFDTIIVDEAHNLKETRTANFQQMQALITFDNTCARCGAQTELLRPDEGVGQLAKVPCSECGWIIGTDTGHEYPNALEKLLSTRSVKNICLTTGTPILNSPTDLYSLLHLLDPILFKTRASFETTFLTNNYHSGKWEFRAGALASLKPLIEGRFLARTREDAGIILPPQHQHVIRVELDPKVYPLQYRTIKQITENAQIVLDSGQALTVMHLIALITRKRQANVHPAGIRVIDKDENSPTFGQVTFDASEVDESVKMDALMDELLDYHRQGRRQIVFSQFTTALDELERRITAQGLRVAKLTGKTTKRARDEIRNNFDRSQGEEARWDVIVAQYRSGGTGLNLAAATVVHVLDEEWSPGKETQAFGRVDRISQTEESDVLIYRVPGTIDSWMANTIHRKRQMIAGFNETMLDAEEITVDSFKEALASGAML